MNHAERVAKLVLERILPGTLEYQHEQSHGECDFALHYHDGTTGVVEVTSSVDQSQTETIAATRNEKKGGSVITATKCRKSWQIVPAKGSRINEIRRSADECLTKLEQAGFEKFSWVRDGHRDCIQEVCSKLKVVSGSVIPTAGASPAIRIAFPIGGGAVGPSTAIEAGEKEAWKPDNRKKLGAAKTAERHLVVYIDTLNGLPRIALTDFGPPTILPNFQTK